ncbi:MAG: hypothetical protein U1E89_07860 [Burkholderiaceae bacterium]
MTRRRFTALPPRSSGSRHIATAVAALAATLAMLPSTSLAAVEFVTTGTCTRVDTQSDNQRLSVLAGNGMRFEVWGDGIDINPSVRVTVDGDPVDALVTARIVRAHNGVENLGRGCKIAKGSVEVEVNSPENAGATRERSLRFRMPLGDESRLAIKVVPHPTPAWTITNVVQTPARCLTKDVGSVVQDLDNSRVIINLPPGASTDTSNCAVRINTTVRPTSATQIDVDGAFRYSVQFPAHLSIAPGSSTSAEGYRAVKQMAFAGNVANIRGTSATRTSTLQIATPNNRSDTLTLMSVPGAANGFTQACVCRNQTTGTTINANDSFQCELRLAQQAAGSGQLISIEAQDRLCVAAGSNAVTYSSASGLGRFTAPATGTFQQIPFRANGGNTSAGTPCANRISPVAQTLKFWVGERGAESGPAFTQCEIRIRN